MKSGFRTSEFWLAVAALLATFYLVNKGLYEADEFVDLLVVVILGYGSSRTILKKKEPEDPNPKV